MTDPILCVVCGVITLMAVPGMLLYTGMTWKKLHREISMVTLLWLILGVISGVTGLLPAGLAILVPSLGIVMTTAVAAALSEDALAVGSRLVVLALFTVLIFFPLAIVVFGDGGSWLYREAGGLDFAGALPVALGTGAFLAVSAYRTKLLARRDHVYALRGAMLVALAAVGSAVGLELRIDDLTPAIALHMVMTPAMALLAAAGVERVKSGRNTRDGLAIGVLAGTSAALASSAYLETVAVLILGILAGSTAAVTSRSTSAAWRLATPLLVGGVIGMLFLGIFSLDVGIVYSGQSTLFIRQVTLVSLTLLYATAVSGALYLPFRRIT